MATIAYLLSGVVLLSGFWLLIARRIRGAVGDYAFQSWVLGLVCLATSWQSGRLHLLVLGLSTVVVKGIVIPTVLRHQVKATVYERRETSYHLGFPSALLLGSALSVVGFLVAARLHLVRDPLGEPVLGVAITVVLLGFFTTLARRDAAMQLTGLLVAENGLLLAGLVMSAGLPLLVDFAFFLDVLVGAVVMGFLIARMHETMASTDTSELTRLRG